MIIVYAAVAGQSVVKLYAAAMFPGFFLSFLYLVYIIGWALINPKIAPPLSEEQLRVPVPAWVPKITGSVFQQHAGRACSRRCSRRRRRAGSRPKRSARQLLDADQRIYVLRWCRSSSSPVRCGCLVVRRHSSAGRVAKAVDGVQQLGSPGLSAAGPSASEQGPPTGFYSGSGASLPSWRCCRSAITCE